MAILCTEGDYIVCLCVYGGGGLCEVESVHALGRELSVEESE